MERLVAAAAEEAEERRLRRHLGADHRQAGRRGPGHRVHLLLGQGPPAGRGAVAAHAVLARTWSTSRLPLPDRVADDGAHHGLRSMGRRRSSRLHDGAARRRARREARARAHRRRDRPPAGGRARGRAPTRRCCNVLQVTYTGAILSAGMGHLAFDAVPALMAEATALHDGRRRTGDDHGAAGLQPLRLRHPRGPVPDLRPPAGRGAGLLQRGARLLRLRRATPTSSPRSATSTTTRTPTASASTRPPSAPTRTGPCRSSPWTRRGTPACAPSSARASRRAGWPPWRTASGQLAVAHLDAGARGGHASTSSPTSPAGCPMDVISELVGRPAEPTGPRCGAWPTCWCTARRA